MTDVVMIHSSDPDFYMLMSHILATSGLKTLPADDLAAILSAPLAETAAILVDTSDNIEQLARFCREVKAHGLTAHLPIAALIRARHEQSYLCLLKAGID